MSSDDNGEQKQPLSLDDLEKNFLVGMMSGTRPAPHPILDKWMELEHKADLEAMQAEEMRGILE